MDKAKKVFRNPLFMIAAGAVFGILAKYGDTAYANSIFSYFGLLTSGRVCDTARYRDIDK